MDRFATQKGYLPILCENLDKGELVILEEGSYDLGEIKKRHGGIIPISEEEYLRLEKQYMEE